VQSHDLTSCDACQISWLHLYCPEMEGTKGNAYLILSCTRHSVVDYDVDQGFEVCCELWLVKGHRVG